MIDKKDLVTQEEIDTCLSYLSRNNSNNSKSVQEQQLLKVLHEIQISLDEPLIEDSIDSTRIRVTHGVTISRKGKTDGTIRFQYIKEIPVDYSNFPLRLKGPAFFTSDSSAVGEASSIHDSNNATVEETIIESYEEVENIAPKLHDILGHVKKVYFMPEDYSNRLVVERIHKLRNLFTKDEILSFPSIDLTDKSGLIPI
jgi:hypothetical protein